MLKLHKRAFSLVELSIVLVILGLLVGGVLSGQSLIRASELRSLTTQINNYTTAMQTFRDKYFYQPGDMPNATAFWGKNNSKCPAASGTASATGTCNGNADGYMGDNNYGFGEMFLIWQHLASAGLISGSYTGVAGSGGASDSVIGVNVPASKLSGVGFDIISCVGFGTNVGCYPSFPLRQNTVMQIGAKIPNDMTEMPFLKPSEAWNIDTKMDDGKPGTGYYTAWLNSSVPNCVSSDTASTATYVLNYDSVSCSVNVGM